jgi:hypothetical protein
MIASALPAKGAFAGVFERDRPGLEIVAELGLTLPRSRKLV